MCGIYGIISLKSDETPGRELMSRMGHSIVHRGPDDTGSYHGAGVALGMRRLSIIDLSGGHQPIPNETRTIWAVCNGEIYNFQGLRQELEQQGHRFRCNSDTEVIVHLYEQRGLDFVTRLRGMFGIALYDESRRRLILARDRIGEKPLYFHSNGRRLVFASEIKAILACADVSREVDVNALHDYCALGYVPGPRTMFRGISKLLPGHLMVVENGTVTIKDYWDLQYKQERRSEDEWAEMLRDKLLESIRLQLVSDVPLGAFLSGGIDSSIIVAGMAQNTHKQVNTYSIGFEGRDEYYNELPYARMIAQKYSTNHHEIIVRPNVCELLPRLIWHLDEPIADSALITTYLISRLARETVTVILSGVGGDELFGGYRRYLGTEIDRYYRKLPALLRNRILPFVVSRLPQDRHSALANYARLADSYVRSAGTDALQRYAGFITVFSPAMRTELLHAAMNEGPDGDGIYPVVAKYYAQCGSPEPLDRQMYLDIKTSLPDDLLLLTDKSSMAASIECRSPFLDFELMELTAKMPPSMKVNKLKLKYLLKKVAAQWLPPEILNRKKRGFGAPVGSWFRDQLQPLVDDCLSRRQVMKRGFFNSDTIQTLVASHQQRKADHTDHLLALVNLELWCRIFLDGVEPNAELATAGSGAALQ